MKQHALLYVSAHPQHLIQFQSLFGQHYQIRTASSAQEASETIQREPIALILTEQQLKDMHGVQLLANLSAQRPDVLRAIVAEKDDSATLLQAINTAHVHCCVDNPLANADETRRILDKALHAMPSGDEGDKTATPTSPEDLQAQLTKTKIDLSAVMQELKTTQYQLIISEKMAALGQLVANVGHEINTPVGVMKSSATTMEKLLPAFIKDLPSLMINLPKEHAMLFYDFMLAAASNEDSLSSREERQHRRDLEERFMAAGITDAADLAKTLVEMQMVDIQRFEKLFSIPQAAQILSDIKRLGSMKTALVNLNIAAEKTTKIIQALKSYAYTNKEERFEPVVLDQSLQSILTIYHNLLKHGVQVIKNYVELPPIPGIPDQLGQVWGNLLSNAIYAMRGQGTLTIEVKREEPYALVRIIDTGGGIAPEIINRIFEPFFTTKEAGEGNGLGLDICRRIVERHRGRITVESKPGHTAFSVYLPLVQG